MSFVTQVLCRLGKKLTQVHSKCYVHWPKNLYKKDVESNASIFAAEDHWLAAPSSYTCIFQWQHLVGTGLYRMGILLIVTVTIPESFPIIIQDKSNSILVFVVVCLALFRCFCLFVFCCELILWKNKINYNKIIMSTKNNKIIVTGSAKPKYAYMGIKKMWLP